MKINKNLSDDIRIIKTQRLIIRKVRVEDWKQIQNIWLDEVEQPYAQFDKITDLSDKSVYRRIERWASFESSDEHMFYAVCYGKIIVGYIAFNKKEAGYEIGYCFHSEYHGMGYAKESITALLGMIQKTDASCVIARTALKNLPSVKLLTSLKFELIGVEEVSFYKDKDDNSIFFTGGIYKYTM